jgi:hypothetical protein
MEDYRVFGMSHQVLDQERSPFDSDLPYLLEDCIELHYSLHDFQGD